MDPAVPGIDIGKLGPFTIDAFEKALHENRLKDAKTMAGMLDREEDRKELLGIVGTAEQLQNELISLRRARGA